MSKRTQKESGEERAKVKTNDEFDCTKHERAPSALSSTAPESPEKSRHESRSPLSSQAEKYDRTGKPVVAGTRVTSATDPLHTNTHQPTQNGTLLKIGLLKSWNLMDWWMIERWDPLFALKVERINSSLKTQNGIRIVVRIQIILAQGERSSAKKAKKILNRCNRRQRRTFCDMVNCSCLHHWKHLYSWWRITQTIGIPLEIQKISQWNRCSTNLRNWYPNNQMRYMEWKQLTGKTLHGSICLWLVMNKFVFSAQKSTYFQILYGVLERWREPSIKHSMGT